MFRFVQTIPRNTQCVRTGLSSMCVWVRGKWSERFNDRHGLVIIITNPSVLGQPTPVHWANQLHCSGPTSLSDYVFDNRQIYQIIVNIFKAHWSYNNNNTQELYKKGPQV